MGWGADAVGTLANPGCLRRGARMRQGPSRSSAEAGSSTRHFQTRPASRWLHSPSLRNPQPSRIRADVPSHDDVCATRRRIPACRAIPSSAPAIALPCPRRSNAAKVSYQISAKPSVAGVFANPQVPTARRSASNAIRPSQGAVRERYRSDSRDRRTASWTQPWATPSRTESRASKNDAPAAREAAKSSSMGTSVVMAFPGEHRARRAEPHPGASATGRLTGGGIRYDLWGI